MQDIIDYLKQHSYESFKTKAGKYVRVKDLMGIDKLMESQNDATKFVENREFLSWRKIKESKALEKLGVK
jgi:hypothetical protein